MAADVPTGADDAAAAIVPAGADDAACACALIKRVVVDARADIVCTTYGAATLHTTSRSHLQQASPDRRARQSTNEKGHCVPNTLDKVRKVVQELGLDYVKIHALRE
uniref:Uncharacterized protein n=1 Tax=Oryza brachyantha TaxID=4533 RepID=J3L0C2_ORYBR